MTEEITTDNGKNLAEEKAEWQRDFEALRAQNADQVNEIKSINKRLGKYVAALQAIINVVQAISD